MTTAALQCKNCGANLVPDPQNPYNYYCPCCRSKYAPEQNDTYVTNEYRYDNNVNVGAGGVINQTIFEQSTLRQDLASANAKLRIGDYDSAFYAFDNIADKHSDCGEAWWGLARAITRDFSLNPASKSQFLSISKYMENAIIQAGDEKREYQQKYNSYRTYWKNYEEQLIKHREKKFSEISARLEAEKKPIQSEIDNALNQVAEKQNRIQKYEKRGTVVPLTCFIIVGLLLLLITTAQDPNSFVANLLGCAILSGVFIWLPLKIIFCVICKPVKLATEVQISKLNRQLGVLQGNLHVAITKAETEMEMEIEETAWLDK